MICVYVGGAYSAESVTGVFDNIRRGMHLAKRVLDAGFAPFTPWHDWLHLLVSEADVAKLQAASLAWLEKSDAMLVVQQNLEGSKGTQEEMKRARELGIPVFKELRELCEWRATRENAQRQRLNEPG